MPTSSNYLLFENAAAAQAALDAANALYNLPNPSTHTLNLFSWTVSLAAEDERCAVCTDGLPPEYLAGKNILSGAELEALGFIFLEY
ncbi:MAG: hypothetical protein AB7G80_04995 [Dongiaceae bacterium]